MTIRDASYKANVKALVRPLPNHIWSADYPLKNLEEGLASLAKHWGGLNLTPDFQRGHVWTQGQQERYVEALMRGALPSSCLLIQFNHPHWDDDNVVTDLPYEVQCVDGLQRITALRRFLNKEICAFELTVDAFTGTCFDLSRSIYAVKFAMHAFASKADLLRFYLDLNSGGTPHSKEELDRVRGLLADSQNFESSPTP